MRRIVKGRKGFWFAAAIATLLYTILSLPSLGNDPKIKVLAVTRLPDPLPQKEIVLPVEGDWQQFSNLENFGFYSQRSGLEACFQLEPHTAVNGDYLIDSSPERDRMVILRLREGKRIEFSFTGYPFIENSRIFLVRPDQQGVREINGEGATIWNREFGSMMTSASVAGRYSAWGTLEGDIIIQTSNDQFKEIRPLAYGLDSAQACVYSTAVSADGIRVAALYGLNPQYALFFEDKGGVYTLVNKRKLEEKTTHSESALFSTDGYNAALWTAAGLLIYDSRGNNSSLVHVERFGGEEGEAQMEALGKDAIVILNSSKNGKYLSLLRKGILEAYFKVDDDATGLSVQGSDSIFVSGRDFLRRYGTNE